MKKREITICGILMGILILTMSGCSNKKPDNETVNGGDLITSEETIISPSGDEIIFDLNSVTKSKDIIIDGNNINDLVSYSYDGLGMVTANNSSRLLLDYKSENPEAYWEILNDMFGKDGLNLSLIKIEMGADVDSSSGTEPAVKRSLDEIADVTKGANYQLAADAKTINPDISVDILYWGLPAWVGKDEYETRYQWYKETIDAMYDTYGLKIDYVTVTQNEKSIDTEWIKYFAEKIKSETDERYDYDEIQIVAGEGVGGFGIAQSILGDEELMDAVDVVTAHYTSWTSENAKKVQNEHNKRVWFSEGSSPMNLATETYAYDGTNSGLSGLNGTLDIATRITQAMAEGMTMYEFQPVVSSYYSGVTYYPKQLITANEPWSGAYSLDAGFYMALHFSRFIQTGWKYVDEACYGDGVAGGDGHAIVDSIFNYMTCVNPETEDYSTVLVNNSSETIAYTVYIKSLSSKELPVYVWETRGPDIDSGDYYNNFFQKLGYVLPENMGPKGYMYEVVVKPYSMITLSTTNVDEINYQDRSQDVDVLSLPYKDDFEYSEYAENFLASRGMAPRYTTDQGGAFEVSNINGNNVLMQKITFDNKPIDWAKTSDPTTNLGDDRWSNYSVSFKAHFTDEKAPTEEMNYVGIGARYLLADNNQSGYWLKVSENGSCELMKNDISMISAVIPEFDQSSWHEMVLTVYENHVEGYVDGTLVVSIENDESIYASGRVAIYSSYQNNYFDDLSVMPIEGKSSTIIRINDLNEKLVYSEGSNVDDGNGWYFNTMSSYKNFGRTISTGNAGDSVTFTYEGSGFAVIGALEEAKIEVTIDGKAVEKEFICYATNPREANYYNYNLEKGSHTVNITVLEGTYVIDAIEFE